MAIYARFGRTVEVAANVAVIAVAVVMLWGVAKGQLSSRPTATARSNQPLVQDIEKDGLTITVKLLTVGVRPHQPVIIELSDFNCPFCRRFATESVPSLRREFIDTGKVGFAFLQLPLERIHPQAFDLAKLSTCAADQGRFWEVHDFLFSEVRPLSTTGRVPEEFGRFKLTSSEFEDCLRTADQVVRKDLAEAKRLGISATPTVLTASSSTPPGLSN